MATNTPRREGRETSSNTENNSSNASRGKARSGKTFKQTAAAAMNTETIIELVQRLGVVDMAVDRLRSRAEEIDYDEILDSAARYIRRNPEVIVVGLGVMTMAAAAIVWLENRADHSDDWDDEEDERPRYQPQPQARSNNQRPGQGARGAMG